MTMESAINTTKHTPIVRWPGGKTRLLKHILPLITPHVCYCEPFAGGIAVLMRKERSHVEVINDINGDLIALYHCVQYHQPELIRELGHMISSRQNIRDFIQNPGLTDIQRAARFYARNRTSFAGGGTSFGITKTKGGGCSFPLSKNIDLLGQARDRLEGVIVENISYERCMGLYDSPDTLFFLDPPYLNADPGKAYKGWSTDDIKSFRSHVEKLQGKWIVTLDDSDLVRSQFSGCKFLPISTRNRCTNNRTHSDAIFCELIITPA